MKKQSFLFSILTILFLCFSVNAQTPNNSPQPTPTIETKKEQTVQEKQDEIEVTKFADSFLDSFIETQDIEKIPANFFDKDFNQRFRKYGYILDILEKKENISDQEKYKRNIIFHNLFNLISLSFSYCLDDNSDSEDYESSELYKKCLPREVLNKINQTKFLKMIINDEENHKNPESPSEITDFFNEMSFISNELKDYLRNNSVKNSKGFAKVKERFSKYYPADLCEGEKCMGLPEKTPIFSVHQLLMCLRIAKINGEWKIIQIYSVASED